MDQPLQKYSEYTTHKGDTITIVGEVFNQPIKENENVSLYTRIQILHKEIEVSPTRYMSEQLSFEDLKSNVDNIKKNITKYLQ